MKKYIIDATSWQELCNGIACYECSMLDGDSCRIDEYIQKQPVYEERPHGEWIFSGVEHTSDNPIDSDSYYCSICKRSISTTLTRPEDLFPFCHCGADMRKRGEAE